MREVLYKENEILEMSKVHFGTPNKAGKTYVINIIQNDVIYVKTTIE